MQRPWEDYDVTMSQIHYLISGRFPFNYAGWRIEGDESDKKAPKDFIGVAGIWPQPAQVRESHNRLTLIAPTHYYHYTIVGEAPYTETFRRVATTTELRPDILTTTAGTQSTWDELSETMRSLAIVSLEAGARGYDVPLAFMLFLRVKDSGRLYVQFWHPDSMPPQVAFEMLQSLAIQGAIANS